MWRKVSLKKVSVLKYFPWKGFTFDDKLFITFPLLVEEFFWPLAFTIKPLVVTRPDLPKNSNLVATFVEMFVRNKRCNC